MNWFVHALFLTSVVVLVAISWRKRKALRVLFFIVLGINIGIQALYFWDSQSLEKELRQTQELARAHLKGLEPDGIFLQSETEKRRPSHRKSVRHLISVL